MAALHTSLTARVCMPDCITFWTGQRRGFVKGLQISWDGHLRPRADSSNQESSEDEEDLDDAEAALAVPAAVDMPTPSVHPVDYPTDDIQIRPEETVDNSDVVARDSIQRFYI